MKVHKLAWLGTRTDRSEEMVRFLRDVMGLRLSHSEPGFDILKLPDGAHVEVFGRQSRHNQHIEHPLVGFLVDDVETAANELRQAGIDLVIPVTRDEGDAWVHFRGPDGYLYELTQAPHVRRD